MKNPEQILLIVAVVGYVMARRFMGRPVDPRRYAILPLGLTAYGATLIGKAGHPSHTDMIWLLLSGAFSVGAGLLRGSTIRLYERDGVLWQRYRPVTIVLWIATIAIRFGIDAVATSHSADHAVMTASALMMFGITLGAESLTVLPRAWSHGTPIAVRA